MSVTREKNIKSEIAYELHKPARRNYPRRHVNVEGFKDLFQADLVEMIPYAKENKGYRYMLTVIDVFSKFAWAVPIKRKTGLDVTKGALAVLNSADGRLIKPPRYLQVDEGKEFYNKHFKNMLKQFTPNIKMYSTCSNKKASVVERFNRTLKNLMWREFSAQGSYKWLDMLPKLLHKYNNTKHRMIKMKPSEAAKADERVIRSIHFNNNSKDLKKKNKKFKIDDRVRISHLKGVFEKGYTPNWSTEIFSIIKVHPTRPVTYSLEDYRGQPIKGTFYEHELSKTNFPDTYLAEKILKRRGDRVLVKWLGFDKSHNTWEDLENIV